MLHKVQGEHVNKFLLKYVMRHIARPQTIDRETVLPLARRDGPFRQRWVTAGTDSVDQSATNAGAGIVFHGRPCGVRPKE